MSDLRKYAATMAEMFSRGQGGQALPYELLVEHGEEAVWSELPEGESYGNAKACYKNATNRVLLGDGELTYYEGLVNTSLGLPVAHAWAQDADGRVYELTLRHNDTRCPFCDGKGTLHPTEHYSYYPTADDEEWGYSGPEEMDCDRCDATGVTEGDDRTGTRYLGVPVPSETLRASVLENQVWGVLFTDPERVARTLSEEAA